MPPSPHYHANIHQPGYLPEHVAGPFNTASEAWGYLNAEIDRAWDQEYDTVTGADSRDRSDARLAIDARYVAAHSATPYQSGPGHFRVEGPTGTHLGHVYEVTDCTDACPDDEP